MKFAAAAKTKLILLIGLLLLGARAQKEEPEYATETERKFDYINAFLTGFKSQETLPSAQNCSMYLEQSIEVFNSTKLSWKNDTTTENWGNMDYILNTTSWISFSLAPSSRYCFTSVLEMYKWYLVKDEQFEGFGDVFAAWLQNLLGNVITFNSLYKKINEANEAENMREVYYWYGRFFTLFINFEPIEDDTLDDLDDFDDGGFFATDKSIYSFGLGLQAAHEALSQEGTDVQRLLRDSSYFNERQGPIVGGFFSGSYGFTMGFVNSTFNEKSPNMTLCQNTIKGVVSDSILFYDYLMSPEYETLVNSAASFQDILGAVHILFESCYLGGIEYGQSALHYKTTLEKTNHLVYNLLHHSGVIYDTIFYLRKHQATSGELAKMDGEAERNWWFKLGIYYGTLTRMILYTGEEPVPYDAFQDYTGLKNE